MATAQRDRTAVHRSDRWSARQLTCPHCRLFSAILATQAAPRLPIARLRQKMLSSRYLFSSKPASQLHRQQKGGTRHITKTFLALSAAGVLAAFITSAGMSRILRVPTHLSPTYEPLEGGVQGQADFNTLLGSLYPEPEEFTEPRSFHEKATLEKCMLGSDH